MSWSVMQTELEPPTAEQLKSAFSQVPGMTAVDAISLGRDAIGMLAKGFDETQARAMQAALAGQGVMAEVVEEKMLTGLPVPQKAAKLEFTPEALRVDNLVGRITAIPWQDVMLIAAGKTKLTEFTQTLTPQLRVYPDGEIAGVTMAPATREVQNDHLLLEIVTRGAGARFSTVADQPTGGLLFQCLGERRTRDPAANLCLLVQDLSKFAPNAVLNHGAFYMREENDASFYYQSKGAFYREITWLLWMIATGRAGR